MQTSVYELDDPYRRLCQVRACAIEAAHGIAAGVLIWRYGTTVGARAGAKHESSGANVPKIGSVSENVPALSCMSPLLIISPPAKALLNLR